MVFFEQRDIEPYGLSNLAGRFLASSPLADTSGRAQTLSNPVTVFAFEHNCLAHAPIIAEVD